VGIGVGGFGVPSRNPLWARAGDDARAKPIATAATERIRCVLTLKSPKNKPAGGRFTE
jgi:hypothetical protein